MNYKQKNTKSSMITTRSELQSKSQEFGVLIQHQANVIPGTEGEIQQELSTAEKLWLERWESQFLAYADVDLHY